MKFGPVKDYKHTFMIYDVKLKAFQEHKPLSLCITTSV